MFQYFKIYNFLNIKCHLDKKLDQNFAWIKCSVRSKWSSNMVKEERVNETMTLDVALCWRSNYLVN